MYTFYFITLNHVKCVILLNVELYIGFLVQITVLLEMKIQSETGTETELWR